MSALGQPWRVDTVHKVTDGDTVRVFRSRPYELDGRHYRLADDPVEDPDGVSLRLVWVNTPEKRDPVGWRAARADLTTWLTAAQAKGEITVVCYESGGWDRLMADLIDADGGSASQWLMVERGWPPYLGDG